MRESETLKLSVQLWYKIHICYVGHTLTNQPMKNKCCEYSGPEGVVCICFNRRVVAKVVVGDSRARDIMYMGVGQP